jgi:tagatose 6-phosphate kinase
MCITIIDHANGSVTELVEEAREVSGKHWNSLRESFLKHVGQSKLVVLSGSLPAQSDPHLYQWCIEQAHKQGIQCIVDASDWPLRQALLARPLLVKPNRSELAKTLMVEIPDDATLKERIRQLIAIGPQWALITLGKEGSVLSNGSVFWRITSPPIRAISPIGSGDAFAAGLAAAIHDGQPPPEAVRLGCACAAANAMIPIAGHLRLDDVKALLPQIRVEPW